MFLEKLEIQGFKSFANKNLLVFPGMVGKTKRGITAVVGPNGCGKSNVADSVRWALGEQSMKMLRGKKSEDVIFSGSDKKGRLGMAEVSMYLNNESKQAPIDYSEVVITRRLYRNGDSEYLLNNSRVRLSDIQMLLAKAKFGQKTYSVIGQGTVEGFLNTSLSERKEFFDEATGVKQFQIKRDDSLNKLRLSYENLDQAGMLLSEIEPRLKSLTRQVNKLHKRGEIEAELKRRQRDYYAAHWHDIHTKFKNYNERFLEKERVRLEKDKKIAVLTKELDRMEAEDKSLAGLGELQAKLNQAQTAKDDLTRQLARAEAEFELRLEASGQFDLSWLHSKREELIGELAKIEEEINGLNANIEPEQAKLKSLTAGQSELEQKFNRLNEAILSAKTVLSDRDLDQIQTELKLSLTELERAEAETDVDRLKAVMVKIKDKLRAVLKLSLKRPREENLEHMHEELMKITREKDALSARMNDSALRISARSERVKLLAEKKSGLARELSDITAKLDKDRAGNGADNSGLEALKNMIEKADREINLVKEKINAFSSEEEAKRSRLFEAQRNIQATQEEINRLSVDLNELKINSTRYETRLEDLEIEIRQQYGDLSKVREHRPQAEMNYEDSSEKINNLKRQLDQIGGIDPEVEKEYTETKERFDFLSGQVTDLTDAIGSLEKVVKELDLTIKERFDKEFKVIADKFNEYFKILFHGGNGKIIKVMEREIREMEPEEGEPALADETSQPGVKTDEKFAPVDMKKIKFLQKHNATGLAGIEIQAVPPGKKIRSIAMLSGGERAMTAIALICAIISANPSPFVILDEVDAALDEANSERLAKILDDLSHKTQFIVITHNRASMRRANILYGVTMGDDGVSKLLSIKLDEAAKTVAG